MATASQDTLEDTIMLNALQDYEDSICYEETAKLEERGHMGKVKEEQIQRFASPVTEEDILKKIEGTIPMTTKKTIEWAKRLWEEWKSHRSISSAEIPPSLEGIDNTSLNHWLPRCVMESRKQDGNYYTGGTLYSLCAGVQRYVREERIKMGIQEHLDIFKEPTFEYFRRAFDSTLKELHRKGVGTTVKQAEVISLDLEERLWNEGALGDDNPQQLLDTLVFMFGLHFALRSGAEHRSLRPDMLALHEPDQATSYLLYTESGSKNHSGGLKERKLENKSVKLFANEVDERKCAVRMYSYLSCE